MPIMTWHGMYLEELVLKAWHQLAIMFIASIRGGDGNLPVNRGLLLFARAWRLRLVASVASTPAV